jgi:hypothetical protein
MRVIFCRLDFDEKDFAVVTEGEVVLGDALYIGTAKAERLVICIIDSFLWFLSIDRLILSHSRPCRCFSVHNLGAISLPVLFLLQKTNSRDPMDAQPCCSLVNLPTPHENPE